jgi:RsiW-degrading membrane proteinase PrsW (M82 family)
MEEHEQLPQCIIPIHKPSWKELAFFFSSGILVSIPFTLFFSQTYSFFPTILTIVVFAPLVEEVSKVFPLFYRHGETERSLVTFGILIGLGFGIAEFFLYVFFFNVSPLARVAGVVFHATSTAITAYGIAKKSPILYYLIAVGLHMVYNFFAVTGDPFFGVLVGVLVLTAVYLLAWRYWHKAAKDKMVV